MRNRLLVIVLLLLMTAACAENDVEQEDVVIEDCALDLSGTEVIIYQYTAWDVAGLERTYGDFEFNVQGFEGTDWPVTSTQKYLLRGSYFWEGPSGVSIGLTGNFERYACDQELVAGEGSFEIAIEITSLESTQNSLVLGITDPEDSETLRGIGLIEPQ
ncbi:MAG: hypothetical protein P9M14_16760 [Candidatus Alcyoniella australis]|nr:hypothetical protein [Candidatus Alcyoniella australis]